MPYLKGVQQRFAKKSVEFGGMPGAIRMSQNE